MAKLFAARLVYSKLPALEGEVRHRAGLVVRKAALDIEAYAKSVVPVRTGNLKNSIQTHQLNDLQAIVGTPVEYAAYVEYGTYKMAPRPYLTPAAEAVWPEFVNAMRGIIK